MGLQASFFRFNPRLTSKDIEPITLKLSQITFLLCHLNEFPVRCTLLSGNSITAIGIPLDIAVP